MYEYVYCNWRRVRAAGQLEATRARMESAERELEETRGRAEALDRALAATRSAHEQREREVEVAIKDFKYVHHASRLSHSFT